MNLTIVILDFAVRLYGGSEVSKHLSKCFKISDLCNGFKALKHMQIMYFSDCVLHYLDAAVPELQLTKPAVAQYYDISSKADRAFSRHF